MTTTKRAKSEPAPADKATNDWSELALRWQEVGAQWMQLWTKAALGTSQPTAPVSVFPVHEMAAQVSAVSIDPAAAAQLTERYARRFEALWAGAAEGAHRADADAGRRRPALLGQGLARASLLRVAARCLPTLWRVCARARRTGGDRRRDQEAAGLSCPAVCRCDFTVEFSRHQPRGAATRARHRRRVDRARAVEPGHRRTARSHRDDRRKRIRGRPQPRDDARAVWCFAIR